MRLGHVTPADVIRSSSPEFGIRVKARSARGVRSLCGIQKRALRRRKCSRYDQMIMMSMSVKALM